MGHLVKFTLWKHEDLSSVLGTIYKKVEVGDAHLQSQCQETGPGGHVGFAGQTDRQTGLSGEKPICHLRNDTRG